MELEFLIDTNATIDYLTGKLPDKGLDFLDKVIECIPAISVINKIELLGRNHFSLSKYK